MASQASLPSGMGDGRDALKKSASIDYRSSTQIQGVQATAKFDAAANKLLLNLVNEESQVVIDLLSIENLKAKDYLEDDNYCWVIAIQEKEGTQHSLQYRLKEDRDAWTGGLRSAIAAATANIKDAEEDQGPQYKRITEVELKEPEADVLATVAVSLDGGSQALMIHLSEGRTSAQEIKHQTQDFIAANEVDPRESTSLYRFLRTVAQRAVLEKETIGIVGEIQRHCVAHMLEEAEGKQDVSDMKLKAEKALTKLQDDIHRRLGEQGTGTSILTMMLRNNIEKMIHINELTARASNPEAS